MTVNDLSQNKWLETFEVGEVRWVERSAIRPPVPPKSRLSKANEGKVFQATAHLAVCQSRIVEPTELWKVERLS